jgi:hypothetical protein
MTPPTEPIEVNRPAIIDETIDNEVVVVDLERGSYYSIRGAGVDIWQMLTTPTTPEGVVTRIATRYGRLEADVGDAVQEFITELDGHGLLRPTGDEAASGPTVDATAGEPAAFEPPLLEKFTDMEDLLLLDPVHEVDGRGWPHPAPH